MDIQKLLYIDRRIIYLLVAIGALIPIIRPIMNRCNALQLVTSWVKVEIGLDALPINIRGHRNETRVATIADGNHPKPTPSKKPYSAIAYIQHPIKTITQVILYPSQYPYMLLVWWQIRKLANELASWIVCLLFELWGRFILTPVFRVAGRIYWPAKPAGRQTI